MNTYTFPFARQILLFTFTKFIVHFTLSNIVYRYKINFFKHVYESISYFYLHVLVNLVLYWFGGKAVNHIDQHSMKLFSCIADEMIVISTPVFSRWTVKYLVCNRTFSHQSATEH